MTALDRLTAPDAVYRCHLNTACGCKVANHVHGTRVCYVIDKCRCTLCRIASVSAERLRRRQVMEARWGYREPPYVDASSAVAHVRALMAVGLGWKQVAKRAGLDNSLVYPLLFGRSDRNGGAPRTKCRPSTRDALLAVPFPTIEQLATGRHVDATPSVNRVHALARLGYSASEQARLAGIEHQAVHRLWADAERTTVRTHRAIAQLFDRLWATPASPTDWHAKAAASRSRNAAARNGWPAPLDLDDNGLVASTEPEHDAEREAQRGWGADLDEWKRLVTAGEHPERAARRCGVGITSIEKQARRVGRPDVLQMLSRSKEAAA